MGFEVNLFLSFLSKCKLDKYTKEIIELFKKEYEEILHNAEEVNEEYVLPKLSISEKVFADEIEKYYMNIGKLIDDCKADEKIINLLKLGWLACLEPLCNYRKAGNGLKIKNMLNLE